MKNFGAPLMRKSTMQNGEKQLEIVCLINDQLEYINNS